MLNWLRGKVSRDVLTDSSHYDTVSKDELESPTGGKNTLVVVRDGAVPKMTLESNELQLLQDIPEFKPILNETGNSELEYQLDAKALLSMSKIYQDLLHQSAHSVHSEQTQLTTKMKEVDMTIKVLLDRLSERQRAYAKAAEQLRKTSDITQSLKKLRTNIRETEEMLRQLNDQLPPSLQLQPFHFVQSHTPE